MSNRMKGEESSDDADGPWQTINSSTYLFVRREGDLLMKHFDP